MRKAVGVALVCLLGAGWVAYCRDWPVPWRGPGASTSSPLTPAATNAPASATPATAPASGSPSAGTVTTSTGSPAAATSNGVGHPFNLLAPEAGARVESVTSETPPFDAWNLIGERSTGGWYSTVSPRYPQELVYSFFSHQTAVVSSVLINPATTDRPDFWAKDVEIWVSVDSPTGGFSKAGATTLRPEAVDQTLAFEPVEARYLKLRILSNNGGADTRRSAG